MTLNSVHGTDLKLNEANSMSFLLQNFHLFKTWLTARKKCNKPMKMHLT